MAYFPVVLAFLNLVHWAPEGRGRAPGLREGAVLAVLRLSPVWSPPRTSRRRGTSRRWSAKEQPSLSEAFATVDPKVRLWVERFLEDLAVVRSANTVRAYRHDLGQTAL